MRRACLIVDHPLRDLDGLVLLGLELVRRNYEVFLVPMYQKQEVLLLRPDIVVVNYVRYANGAFVALCRRLGITVAVLDTEGGVRGDFSGFAASVEPYLDDVSLYCVWGLTQERALAAAAAAHGLLLRATGCPRYDFAVAPWIEAVRNVEPGSGPMILVNTNFPLVNPRFQSVEREVQELVKVGYTEAYARARIEQTLVAQAEMVRVTRRLGERFPAARVVLRPHPFESVELYQERLGDLPNVRIVQSGSVFEWIKPAAVLVHHNCQTAIDAVLMGREPVHVGWIDAPLLLQPATADVSQQAHGPEELDAMVAAALGGVALPVPEAVAVARQRVVEDFFFANDGCAAVRVADAMDEALLARPPRVEDSGAAYAWRVLRRERGWKRRLQHLVLFGGGHGAYAWARRFAGGRRLSEAKAFGPVDVREIALRLTAVLGAPPVPVRSAGSADAAWPAPGGMYLSVRMARAAAA
jgi:surface carbohydrate biosynthesis protein